MANPDDFENRLDRFDKAVDNRDKVNEAKDRVAEQQKIAAALVAFQFDKSKTKTVTLDDGTKAYSDGNKMLISDKEGVFVAENSQSSGLYVSKVGFNNSNDVAGGNMLRVENDPGLLKDKLDKMSEACLLHFGHSDLSDAIDDTRRNVAQRVGAQAAAEQSPQVKQAKELALKQFGFDEQSLKVEALANGEVAIVAKNGVAIGKGDTFYFTPKQEDFENMSYEALKEVTLNAVNGKDPMFMSMTVGENPLLVKQTYDKMQNAYMNVSDYDMSFASMLSQLQNKAEDRLAFNQNVGKDR